MTVPTGCEIVQATEAGLCLRLSTSLYRELAVKKAAYAFGGRFYVLLEPAGENTIRALLRPKGTLTDPALAAEEFCNVALDYELREVVADETRSLRSLILANAFSKTSLVDNGLDSADYRDDPHGISEPTA
ncbi:MAG: His-Xaa-Ser system protein HxsD [Phycisphaerae bacterium]|jgi:His-Xaa-Ser system protein HxsD